MKSRRKVLLSLVMIFTLVLMTSACGSKQTEEKEEEQPSEPAETVEEEAEEESSQEQDETEELEEATEEESAAEEEKSATATLVQTVYAETIDKTYDFGSTSIDFTNQLIIPEIRIKGDPYDEVNGLLRGTVLRVKDENLDNPDDKFILNTNYDWYSNGDYLSILMIYKYGWALSEGGVSYETYTFDLKNNALMDMEDIAKAAGFTEEEIIDRAIKGWNETIDHEGSLAVTLNDKNDISSMQLFFAQGDELYAHVVCVEDTGYGRDKIINLTGKKETVDWVTLPVTEEKLKVVESLYPEEFQGAPKEDTSETPKEEVKEGSLPSDFLGKNFVFASGAGAWGTVITLNEDGSFEGSFHDSNMGEIGDGYPNGTVYICEFKGKFTDIKPVEEGIWSMRLESLETEGEPGTEEIKDGVLFVTAEPYGMDGGENYLALLPGASTAMLGEESWPWFYGVLGVDIKEVSEMPAAAIYNVESGYTFVSAE